MALIYCPECQKQISDKAEACPHCGLPRKYFAPPNGPEVLAPAVGATPPSETDYKTLRNMFISFDSDYAQLFHPDRYIATSAARTFYNNYFYYLKMLKDPIVKQYTINLPNFSGIDSYQISRFTTVMDGLFEKVDKANEDYLDKKLAVYQTYFDDILKTVDPNVMLDEEQRRAVLTDEDYCLLIAGAGAGKTTTMAAKVKFLVDCQNVRSEDIIVISYTNKAIDELKDRINKKLKIPVKISTFHSFGYEILRRGSDTPPSVNYGSYNIIFDFIQYKVYENKKLLSNLVKFLGYYFDMPEDVFKFESLNQYCEHKSRQIYETIKSRIGEYIRKVISLLTRRTRTITGEFLRSIQEVQIANFLYLNNIDYEYEKPYKYPVPGASKMYTPDFYISQGDNECYIEHFGVSENYQSRLYTRDQLDTYVRHITHKRKIHQQNGTSLIQTWSSYNDQRPLLEHLEEDLQREGFVLKPRDDKEVYMRLADTGKDKYVYKLIMFLIEFIEKYKTCGYDEAGFAVLRKKTDNVRNRLFLDIAEEVYLYYQDQLKQKNQIDFADMINDAEELLRKMKEANYKPSYKYIIIDEFQDIARQRFNLTKALVDVTGAKVVAVGDDWQSIFAFAGSDITLFQKFLELMGEGKEMQITHTYRNSQQLIDIAGSFIQKNPSQIKKRLISPKNLENPVIVKSYDDTPGSIRRNWFQTLEDTVGAIVVQFGPKSSILMISRYNFDMDLIARSGLFESVSGEKLRCKKYPSAPITFLTAHSSKGLGFDNVILVNMQEAKFGFPSQLEDDPIMKLVTHEDNTIDYAEERRLFYVALTRTKNRVYIVSPRTYPSRFVVELIKDYNIPHDKELRLEIVERFQLKCPICGAPLKYENNKNYGIPLYMCTNEPEICDFMTNDRKVLKDIFKCPKCDDGYMIVRHSVKNDDYFYGCTNYDKNKKGCGYMERIRWKEDIEKV